MSLREGSAAKHDTIPTRPLPHPRWRDQPRLLRQLFRDPAPVLERLRDAHGPVTGLGVGPVRLAIVGDASAARELLMMPTDRFRWGHKFNVLGFVVGNESMIVSDGDDHRRRRSSVQAAFSRRRLAAWIPMIVDRTDRSVDRLLASASGPSGPEPIDLYPAVRALALEVVTRALFGEHLAARSTELLDVFRRSQDYLAAPAVRQIPHPLPRTARARVRDDRRALDAMIDAEIERRRSAPTGDSLDILESLVADGSLSDSEMRDQVATLIGAGFDTTAASLAWMLWRATLTPGIWDVLRTEADQVLGYHDGPRRCHDHETLSALVAADRVMHETLRLHPAGVVAPREAATVISVAGYRIPAGTLILWSPYLIGRDPGSWPEPERFDPDRFIGLTDERRKELLADWLPFGGGPRNCIGFALAQMELTLVISRLAQRLDLRPVSTQMPAPVGMVVNRPRGGVPMHVVGRTR